MYSLQFGRQGKSCFEDFCIISVTNKRNIFQAPKSFRIKKDQRKKSNNIIQLPPRKKKNFEILSPNSYTLGKPPWVFWKKTVRLEFRILSVLKLAPFFREAFRSFPATGILPNPSTVPVLDTLTRQVAKVGLHFCNQGIFGRKFPWEMWVEKVNIDIADIHNLAIYLYDLFLNTTATACRVHLPTMKG